jgi:hypothetical protein
MFGNFTGLRVQGSRKTAAMIFDILRNVRIGPPAISPRQLLLS